MRLLGSAAEHRVGRGHARALGRRRAQLERRRLLWLGLGELPLERAHAHRLAKPGRLERAVLAPLLLRPPRPRLILVRGQG